jgi:hypothetical protein
VSIIDLPDDRWRSLALRLVRPTQVNRSEFSGARQVMQLPGAPYWTAECEHAPLVGEAAIRPWRRFFAQAEGPVNVFELPATQGPQRSGSDPQVGFATGFTLNNYANMSVSGTTITKVAGAAAYDAAVYSAQDLASPVAVSFRASQVNADLFAGLNDTIGDGTAYARIDYGFWLRPFGTWRTSVGGVFGSVEEGSYTTDTVFTVAYNGTTVTFMVDGRPVRTEATTAGRTFGFDSSFYTVGGALNGVRIGQGTAGVSLLALSGFPASSAILDAGSYLTVPLADGDAQLVVLTAALVSDSGGEIAAQFTPMLRKPPAWGGKVRTIAPFVRMALETADQGYTVDPGALYGFGFAAREAF